VDEDLRRQKEDEWFLQNEKQLLEAARVAREKRAKEHEASAKADELRRLKEQHFMRCPKCGHEMKEQPLEGVAVDRCTFCEGIYFDAGELERLLGKSGAERRGLFRRLVGL
jgi:uncharacterized protein